MIIVAFTGMVVLEPHGGEAVTEVLGGGASQSYGVVLSHHLEDFGSGHPLAGLVTLWVAEAGVEHVFQRGLDVIGLVALLQFLFFVFG